MRTKIIDGTFHPKRKIKFYLEGEIKPVKQFMGRLRIIENEGTTYVVCPISDNILEGLMIPIIENYDSLEEINQSV